MSISITTETAVTMSSQQSNTLLLAIGSISTILAVHLALWRRRQHLLEREYPPMAPAGMWETIQKFAGSGSPFFLLQMARKLGSNNFRINLPVPGTPMMVLVGDLETFRSILMDPTTHRPVEVLHNSLDCITCDIPTIFSTNGDYWHKRRKLLAPAFAPSQVKRMNKVVLDRAENWVKLFGPLLEQGKEFDVAKEMVGIILSAICETAFEYEMCEEEKAVFAGELEICLVEFLFKSIANPFRPLLGRLLPERRRAHLAAEHLMNMAKKIMDNYRTLQSPVKDTIINRIMTHDAFASDKERQAEIVTMLVASHDTTAYSISWTLIELARNPDYQAKLRDSLRTLDAASWNQSEPLRHSIKESMRLHPTVANGSIRALGRDWKTKEGYFIPKGSFVFLPMILLHRNSAIYSEPDTFIPSRWENPTREMMDSYLPFSLGKQNCVGQSLAKIEHDTVVARICSEFSLELVHDGTAEYFLTLKPVGYYLRAKRVPYDEIPKI